MRVRTLKGHSARASAQPKMPRPCRPDHAVRAPSSVSANLSLGPIYQLNRSESLHRASAVISISAHLPCSSPAPSARREPASRVHDEPHQVAIRATRTSSSSRPDRASPKTNTRPQTWPTRAPFQLHCRPHSGLSFSTARASFRLSIHSPRQFRFCSVRLGSWVQFGLGSRCGRPIDLASLGSCKQRLDWSVRAPC